MGGKALEIKKIKFENVSRSQDALYHWGREQAVCSPPSLQYQDVSAYQVFCKSLFPERTSYSYL